MGQRAEGDRGPWLPVTPSLLVTSGSRLLLGRDVVVKIHEPGTDGDALAARLHVLAAGDVAALWVPPLLAHPVPIGGTGRLATLWRRAEVLAPGVLEPPWAEAAALLARMHRCRVPTGPGLPHQGGPARLVRVLRRLEAGPAAGLEARRGAAPQPGAARTVLAAGRRALDDAATAATAATPHLVHGDWHLGQLGRVRPGGRWLLLDVDDVGLGDPAWDLGRPAGFWAAGLLPEEDWACFLTAYRMARGPAVPADGDPWGCLDVPARAAVVVAAARAVLAGGGDLAPGEADTVLVEACARMPV